MSKKIFSKGQVLTTIMVLVAALVMAIPVLANTSNWAWTGNLTGLVVNGKSNGVFHNMTAGNLTFSGSIWATQVQPGAISPSQWTYQVKKDNGLLPDTTICTHSPVATNGILGHSASFNKNCGSISAGSDYYLYVYRGGTDGRAYSSSGTLSTP